MNLLAQTRPPKWPFFVSWITLLSIAGLIAWLQPPPFPAATLAILFGCIALGAVVFFLPFLLDFIAGQRAVEAELLAKLEAQNHKLGHGAEMLINAAGQLKSTHEAATRAVHAAEALPYRMQEKIGEFTAQLQESDDQERAALEKELEALRETEGERLSGMADKIRAAVRDFQLLEKETRPALEAAVRQSRDIETTLTAAAARALAALAQAEEKLRTSIDEACIRATRAVEASAAADTKLAARVTELQALQRELDAGLARSIEQLKTTARAPGSPPAARSPRKESDRSAAPIGPEGDRAADTAVPAASTAERPPPAPPVTHLTAFPRTKTEHASSPVDEPVAAVSSVPTGHAARAAVAEPPPVEAAPKREPRRKPTARNMGEAVLPGFSDHEVVYDDSPAPAASVPAKTSDGTTRLLVTAYIGIGNKIFLRGDGPGLSREKGVPMEFVSIGKWAWQTADATGPVRVQVLKNDELKALGDEIELPPGHHVETTPVFREPDPF